jgi:hypothetical protein
VTRQRREVLQEDRIREAVTDLGGETKLDSRPIARSPEDEAGRIARFGHMPMTPLAALRLRCIDCCGDSVDEVRRCAACACPAWLFRIGINPWRAPLSDAEKVRRRNLLARVGKTVGNAPEPEKLRRADAGSSLAAIAAPEDEATVL